MEVAIHKYVHQIQRHHARSKTEEEHKHVIAMDQHGVHVRISLVMRVMP